MAYKLNLIAVEILAHFDRLNVTAREIETESGNSGEEERRMVVFGC